MRRAIWGVLIISVVSAFGGVASAQVSDEVVRLGVLDDMTSRVLD
ncbi:MAG: hypothetical protein ACI8PT_002379 [Gammaproteobacteria bacterium]|jgi:hypothetical protein|nr:MAG: hypothetical protein OJF48_000416 [Afipia sp.]